MIMSMHAYFTCKFIVMLLDHELHHVRLYTLRQSVMVRPMQPRPATSTTFSCQLSSTLMAAEVESLDPPCRPPIWLKPPVDWGVTFVGVFAELPGFPTAMPL